MTTEGVLTPCPACQRRCPPGEPCFCDCHMPPVALGGVLPAEVWAAATDADCPPGVVRIDGQPFPLVEFMEDDDV